MIESADVESGSHQHSKSVSDIFSIRRASAVEEAVRYTKSNRRRVRGVPPRQFHLEPCTTRLHRWMEARVGRITLHVLCTGSRLSIAATREQNSCVTPAIV